VFGRCLVPFSAGTPTVVTEVSRGIPQHLFVNTVMGLWVPQNSENFFNDRAPVSFSRRTQHHEVCLLVS
jgi:hypothetical protein